MKVSMIKCFGKYVLMIVNKLTTTNHTSTDNLQNFVIYTFQEKESKCLMLQRKVDQFRNARVNVFNVITSFKLKK